MGMNASSCYRHPMNRLALGFFITALVYLTVFHFLPLDDFGRGWFIWRSLYNFACGGWENWENARLPEITGYGLRLGIALQCLAGPFLIPFVSGNKLIHWLMVFVLFGMLVGIGWLLRQGAFDHRDLWIFASLIPSILGCLCIRRPPLEEFVPAPHPDT